MRHIKHLKHKLPSELARNQSGVVSLFVAIGFVAVILMTGLVADGAQIRQERRRLDDLAAQISRVAAQEINVEAWHERREIELNPAQAVAAGQRLLDTYKLTGSVSVTDANRAVEVSLRKDVDPALSVIPELTISATRKAVAATGPISSDQNRP